MTGRRWNRSRLSVPQMLRQGQGSYVPDDETQKLYAAFKAEAEKRQLTSIDNFDKSILTYSSAGLALSLTFLKDFVPIQKASATWLLFGSWTLFVLATCLTIISFLVSNKVQELAISDAGRYYLWGEDEYLDKSRWQNKYVAYSNGTAGSAFVLALAFSTAFVWANINVRKDVPAVNDAGRQVIQVVSEAAYISAMPVPPRATAARRRIEQHKTAKPSLGNKSNNDCRISDE